MVKQTQTIHRHFFERTPSVAVSGELASANFTNLIDALSRSLCEEIIELQILYA